MEKTIIKSLVLLLSIPLINVIVYRMTSSFHNMYEAILTVEHFEAYEFSVVFIFVILGISVPLFESLYDIGKISNLLTNMLYVIVFTIIVYVTYDQFTFNTYEHSLTLLSIVSIIFTREVMNRKVVGDVQYA